jgi:hypothetical protein
MYCMRPGLDRIQERTLHHWHGAVYCPLGKSNAAGDAQPSRQSQAQANLISRSTVALDKLRMPRVSSALQHGVHNSGAGGVRPSRCYTGF